MCPSPERKRRTTAASSPFSGGQNSGRWTMGPPLLRITQTTDPRGTCGSCSGKPTPSSGQTLTPWRLQRQVSPRKTEASQASARASGRHVNREGLRRYPPRRWPGPRAPISPGRPKEARAASWSEPALNTTEIGAKDAAQARPGGGNGAGRHILQEPACLRTSRHRYLDLRLCPGPPP